MAVAGRRPGRRDTRAEIVAAARTAFIEEGYERPSLRSIARRAAVDPALVHHYFRGKPELFTEALKFGRDPRELVVAMAQAAEAGVDCTGEMLVKGFLDLWEARPPPDDGAHPFVTTAQAMCSSPEAAAGLREYLEDRVWSVIAGNHPPGESQQRQSLIASQLIGLACVRYLLRIEPLASASQDDVAAWVGPTLDRYMKGDLPPVGASSI